MNINESLKILKSAQITQDQMKGLVQKIARFHPHWDNEAMLAALAGSFYQEEITEANEERVNLIHQGLKGLISAYPSRYKIMDDYKILTDYFPRHYHF